MTGMASALLFGDFRMHPGRVLTAVIAIATGVAMGYAVHLVNTAASAEFAQSVRSLMGNADLEIRGAQAGFDEALYPAVASLPEVEAASPVVEVDARLGNGQVLKILGLDVFRAVQVAPQLVARESDQQTIGRAHFEPDAVFLSPAALARLSLHVGDALDVQVGIGKATLRIRGVLPASGDSQRLGVMDIGAAQWLFDRIGRIQRIDLKLKPGTDVNRLRARLAAMLPAGVAASTPQETSSRSANLSRAYRVNLNVLALVALFTGAFLVFSTQVLAQLRRRGQFALLRVLGLTRRQLVGQVLAEGAVLGVLGAALGIAVGYGLASSMLEWAGGDLGAGLFSGIEASAEFRPGEAAAFLLLGIAAALLGSLAPALEAALAPPAPALKAGGEEAALRRLRSPVPGLALIAAGFALTLLPPISGLPIAGYIAIALLLIGAIMLMPHLAHAAFARLPLPAAVAPHLALAQLGGAPGRAAIGLGGILASFSLMVAMAIMVASFRVSLDQWLGIVLPADLYVRAGPYTDSAFFSPRDEQVIRATSGVARAEFQRATAISLDPKRPPVALIARVVDVRNPAARIALVTDPRASVPGDPPPIWVSEAMVDLYEYTLGKRVLLPIAGRWSEFVVAGVWRDYARQHGAIVMTQSDYRRLTGDANSSEAAIWLAPGGSAAEVAASLRRRLDAGGRIDIASAAEIRALSLKTFDRSFAVTYVLEAVAIVIGLIGIAASFGGQALSRSREFGMLRHVGVTRAQIGAMLALEGSLLGALGVAAGLCLGFIVAQILIRVVNPQSFHWSMQLSMPWLLLATVASVLIAASAATAVWAGRRAMAADAVRAVKEDW